MSTDIVFKEESYRIMGLCMEVHRILGKGFAENIYKDALEYEFNKNKIPFEREKKYDVKYKDICLQHKYFADFVVFDKIILEIKCEKGIIEQHVKQTLNYIAAAHIKLGIVINFGEDSLTYKRIVL
jgi:GxxExxY protein